MLKCWVLVCCLLYTAAEDITTQLQEMMFLYRYGYISERDMSTISEMEDNRTTEIMRNAIRDYQDRNGLTVTGAMDGETRAEMSLPRCGVKDVIPLAQDVNPRRTKRYVVGSTRWESTMLTYRYIRQGSGNQGRYDFQQEMDRAFWVWSLVSPFQFLNVTSRTAKVDIEILFASGNHGDSNNFDGPSQFRGSTLAHAFYPNPSLGGDIHFDDDETWVINRTGIDFFTVALHELGHSLGLDHSTLRSAIMFPSYNGYRPEIGLHQDDIDGIQSIYGPPSGSGITPRRLPPPRGAFDPNSPNLCRVSRLDAAYVIPGTNDIYLFHGSSCYLLQEGLGGRTAQGFPRLITQVFPGINQLERVDAALAWPNGQVFIFSGALVWTFRNNSLEGGSARHISQVFPGIPTELTGACFWPRDQRTYFFKGSAYWRYDNFSRIAVKNYFPLRITRWKGVSGPVDAVLDLNDDVYFFQGDTYYRYSNAMSRVLSGYPRPSRQHLFGCNQQAGAATADDEIVDVLIPTAEKGCRASGINSGREGKPSGALATVTVTPTILALSSLMLFGLK